MEKHEVIEKLRLSNLINPRIPSHFYEDYEVSLLAVTHSWTALKYIPKKYITEKLCELAIWL